MLAAARAALLALAVIASPQQADLIHSSIRLLPACVQTTLDHQVRGIVVTDGWVLGKPYDGLATEDGIIILTATPADSLRLVPPRKPKRNGTLISRRS